MALIPETTLAVSGTAIPFLAAAANDTARVNSRASLVVKNDSAASVNVTLTVQADRYSQPNGVAGDNTVVAVAAGAVTEIPIGLTGYRNENNEVEIAYSATTDVSRAVMVR